MIPAGTQLQAVGINAERTWIQVNYGAQQGWVAASLMRVINGSLDGLQAGGGAGGGGAGGGTAAIGFTANRTSINSGECVTIRWDVDNINQVYYQGGGVTGHETRRTECPTVTTTYVLRVSLRDGSSVERTVTITVGGGGGCSSLSFALAPTYSRNLVSGFNEPYGLSFTGSSAAPEQRRLQRLLLLCCKRANPIYIRLIFTAALLLHRQQRRRPDDARQRARWKLALQ